MIKKDQRELDAFLAKFSTEDNLIQMMNALPLEMERESTGLFKFDNVLGGGFPVGRVIELYGWESSGKTTLATIFLGQVQRRGGRVGIVDAEHAFDRWWAEVLGLDTENTVINQPGWGEQALENVESMVDSGLFDCILIDSVAALVPKIEVEGEMGDSNMGRQAKMMSQAMRKLTNKASKQKCTLVFINQLRHKIGVMFGSPETTPGGHALKFAASIRIEVSKSVSKQNSVTKGDERLGNMIKVKVVKNKTAPPFKEAEWDLMYGLGVKPSDILDTALDIGVLVQKGSWTREPSDDPKVNGTAVGNGKAATLQFLADNHEYMDELEKKINDKSRA